MSFFAREPWAYRVKPFWTRTLYKYSPFLCNEAQMLNGPNASGIKRTGCLDTRQSKSTLNCARVHRFSGNRPVLFCRWSSTWIGSHEQWNKRECSVDNPLNLYSPDISRLSIFATHEGRLHVYSKWCRFEIPLVLSLSPGTVGARRRPRSYITHVPDARLGQVLRLWVCGGRKRFMAWNDNIGHPIVTKSTTIYVVVVEGLRRREGSIVNLTIYGNLVTLIRSKEICLY